MSQPVGTKGHRVRFTVGVIFHILAFCAFTFAAYVGVGAAITYATRSPEGDLGAGLGAVLLFLLFLISAGVHQVAGYIGIPLLWPFGRDADVPRRRTARILLWGQAVSLGIDYILFVVIYVILQTG